MCHYEHGRCAKHCATGLQISGIIGVLLTDLFVIFGSLQTGGEQSCTAEAYETEFLYNILKPLIVKQISFIAF
jgi:hypothetical protein